MIFKNKKVNIFIFLTIALICVAVILPNLNLEVVTQHSSADSTLDEELIDELENNSGSISESFAGMPKLTSQFTNAWQAYNYALKMSEEYPAYIKYVQTIDGNALNTVGVKVTVSRIILNDVENIYARNEAKTEIDASKVGIDLSDKAVKYISYTHFDFVNDHVQSPNWSQGTIEDYKESHNDVILHTLPYIINESTVSGRPSLQNDPSSDYYKVTMTLNSKAWATYIKVLKAEIGESSVTGGPNISSIVVEFRIDKTYGTFRQVIAKENYDLVYTVGAGLSATVTCEGTIKMTYSYKTDISTQVEEYYNKIWKTK